MKSSRNTDTWRELLTAAVTPLGSGVSELRVRGWQAVPGSTNRPGRTAAVLVGILDQHEPQVVLTRRAAHLALHAGQVSFPGGAAGPGESGVLTALREAEEEIGLAPERVRPLGFLDRLDTISDYRVLPVVALVDPPDAWRVDAREVAEVFTLPLAVALDASAWTPREMERNGIRHRVHALDWEGRNIWGVTAAILVNLAHRVAALHGATDPQRAARMEAP